MTKSEQQTRHSASCFLKYNVFTKKKEKKCAFLVKQVCLSLLGVGGVPEQLAGWYTKRGRTMQGGGSRTILLLFSGSRGEKSLNQPEMGKN